MIYFILQYDKNEKTYNVIYYYRELDDALCFMINNLYYNGYDRLNSYYVSRIDERYSHVDLTNLQPYYKLKFNYDLNKYYLHIKYNTFDDSCNDNIDKFEERLRLFNKLIGIRKKELYKIYRGTDMKDVGKYLVTKNELINKLFKYSFKYKINFEINSEKHNFLPLVE